MSPLATWLTSCAEHGLGLVAVHRAQQAGGHRDQRVVAVGAGGEGVDLGRVVDGDLGHADAGRLRLPLHGGDQPLFGLVARLRDHLRAGGALGDPLRHQQRDERAAEAEERRHHQQAGIGRRVDAEHRHDDADQRQHGQVGGEEQSDTFEHGAISRLCECAALMRGSCS